MPKFKPEDFLGSRVVTRQNPDSHREPRFGKIVSLGYAFDTGRFTCLYVEHDDGTFGWWTPDKIHPTIQQTLADLVAG